MCSRITSLVMVIPTKSACGKSVIYTHWDSTADGGSGGLVAYRQEIFDYYTDSDTFGKKGDLKSVVTSYSSDGTGWAGDDTNYYRYYNTGDTGGFAHGLQYELSPEDYRKAVAEHGSIDSINNANLGGHASHYYEYYFTTDSNSSDYHNNQRVYLEIADGGTRTTTYDYWRATAIRAQRTNLWSHKTKRHAPTAAFTPFIRTSWAKRC